MSFGAALALLALAVGVLLILVLVFRFHGFLALLAVSLLVAWVGGIAPLEVAGQIQQAMGGTLGYIAIVIGLGAIFGEMLQRSGGAEVIARRMLDRFGQDHAPMALGLTGLVVAIPVFFDVAFILFVPLLKTLSRRTGRPLIGFAIPLLAGLAVAHAFIPPTPGPVAVAGLLGADLGWVIVFGLVAGLPALWLAGVVFGSALARGPLGSSKAEDPLHEFSAEASGAEGADGERENSPGFAEALGLVALPLVLILTATGSKVAMQEGPLRTALQVVGHPFVALLLTVAAAWILLGRRCGWSRQQLETMAGRSLEPVGGILLLTGAGGVLGKMLLATGAGGVLAEGLSDSGLPLLLLGFVTALALRIAQGSATVSMVTAAGLIAPILEVDPVGGRTTAALVVAIAAGATACSHVNDSGFWLVSRYLGLTEKETLRSWTLMTAGVGGVGFLGVWIASALLGGLGGGGLDARPLNGEEIADVKPVAAVAIEATSAGEPRLLGGLQAWEAGFYELIPKDSRIEVVAEGFEWAEGPVWVPEQSAVLLSDVPTNRIYRWTEAAGLDVWMEGSGYTGAVPRGGEPGSNGLFLDGDGRLVLAQHGDRRIARLENPWSQAPFAAGEAKFETLADAFDGKRFHSPNDLVLSTAGELFFTDPPYGLEGGPDGPGRELEMQGVFYRPSVASPGHSVELLTGELSRPNGIALSPDEKTLYVANSDPERAVWMAYTRSSESPRLGKGRIFYDATEQVGDQHPGLPDGMAVDVAGHLFATGPGGVWVFDPQGKALGQVRLPVPSANCAFGGADGSQLFITADSYLLRLNTATRGLQPRLKRPKQKG